MAAPGQDFTACAVMSEAHRQRLNEAAATLLGVRPRRYRDRHRHQWPSPLGSARLLLPRGEQLRSGPALGQPHRPRPAARRPRPTVRRSPIGRAWPSRVGYLSGTLDRGPGQRKRTGAAALRDEQPPEPARPARPARPADSRSRDPSAARPGAANGLWDDVDSWLRSCGEGGSGGWCRRRRQNAVEGAWRGSALPDAGDGRRCRVLEDLFGLVAVDADTGQRRWTLRDDSGIEASPVAGTGVVYFADSAGCLTAVDAATGEARWKWRSRRSKMSRPTVADHVVYAASHDSGMWAVDGLTGRPVWNVRVAEYRTSNDPPPTVAHGVLYAAVGGHVLALDTATGSRRWDVFPHGGVRQTPMVAGGSVYVGNDEGLVAMNAATGEERWRLSPEGRCGRAPRWPRASCPRLVPDRGGRRNRSGEVEAEDPR